jgi:diguanylate cyclase (GGDEF)-like protein
MMGFPLRQSLVDGLHDLLHVEVAVLAEPQDGVASVVLSTLGAAHNGVLAQHAGQETQLVLGEDTYAVHPLVLPVTGGQMRTLLLRSVTEAYAPFSRLQAWMAGIGVLGLGGFVWATAHSARRITQPLRALHSAAQALERGAFDRPLPPVTGHDEVAELTRGFDAMRLGLANQQAEIRRLAHRDRLTGLPNRQRFVEALEHAIQQAQGTEQTLVVATLNLNRFKHVNAVMGYGFGDQLLKAVGARLAQGLQQPPQLLARLGGDEFGLMLPGVGAADGEKLVAGLIEVLGQGITLNGQPVDVRVGAGWAIYPQDADSADTLVNRSEMAMRWAKNRLLGVLRYAPGHDTAGPETLTLLGDLRDGMRRGELRLYLQPKWSLDSGRPEAAEALVRWQHPVHGLLPPSRFIPFAEQTGFVCEITRWVLDAAVAACAGWQSECPGCSVAVNVSARDLQSVGFVEHVRSTLQRHNLPARQLELEITESAIMEDTEGALAALNSLSATGVGLSIDDYGTGYSSLSYVRRLPVQTLKIDQAFVRELLINNSDRVIVQSTIDLAHNLGLDVVAEGVECGKTLDLLGRMGCDVVQGYHISRPMPADAFVAWCHSLSAETDGVLT